MGHAPDLRFERGLLRAGATRLVCIDEVGRGALAGPVSVGAVVIEAHTDPAPEGVRDSKLLSAAARERLAPAILDWACDAAVGHATNDEIDSLGIMAALRLAGRRALEQLRSPRPDLALLDGSHDWLSLPPTDLFEQGDGWTPPPVRTKVKADLSCAAVAAASIIAKVERDAIMCAAAAGHPAFKWDENKGYASPLHRAALDEFGPTPLHRVSWRITSSSTAAHDPVNHPQAGRFD